MNPKCVLSIVVISIVLISLSEAGLKPKTHERFFTNDYDESYNSGLEDGRRSFHRHKEIEQKTTEKKNEAVLFKTTKNSKDTGDSLKTTLADKNYTKDVDYSSDPVYIGCFDNWIGFLPLVYSHNDTYTPTTCSQRCMSEPQGFRISFLKGVQCVCSDIEHFNLLLVPDIHCDIKCPIESLPSETSDLTSTTSNSCGGNFVFSVYCFPSRNENEQKCSSAINHSYPIDIYPTTTTEIPSNDDSFSDPMNEARNSYVGCGFCNGATANDHCTSPVPMTPKDHYMPNNSPETCLNFCKRHVASLVMTTIRYPTKYAILKWWPQSPTGLPVPICSCIDDISVLDETTEEYCNATCPGDSSEQCGGLKVYESIYCVDKNACNGGTTPPNCENSSECGGTTPADTPTLPPTSDTQDPSTSDTSTTESATTIVTAESTADFTTASSTTIIPIFYTTEDTKTDFPETSTNSVTEIVNATTTKRPATNCKLRCEKVDVRGNAWNVCAGDTDTKPCSNNSSNHAEWYCTPAGVFATLQPDFSKCRTDWVDGLEKQVDEIKSLDAAEILLERVHKTCKDAQAAWSDSENKYFGHEIGEIVRVAHKVAIIAQNHVINAEKYEKVALTVIDITGSLFAFPNPWKELDEECRSNASNELISSLEETIFALTSMVQEGDAYKKTFAVENSDVSVMGESFHKKSGLNASYTYLSTTSGSYIKLPEGWKTQVSGDQIQIVGLSMNSKIVRGTMPGQFRDLIGSLSDNGEKNKLINGNLMSFSIVNNQKSTRAQSIQFTGKGVEITFKHDVEAWGSETKEIKRKLHNGEEAKAVSGSAKCVYWNTTNLIWSSEGCKLIASDRYSTTCECEHLTSFAILMDAHKYVGKDRGLEILTLILCPLSIICLLISVVIFSTVHSIQNPRTVITKHLSICLFIGTTLVLLVIDRNYFNMNEEICIASGIIAHYAFLCAFLWMAVEGWHLYKMVVHVFDSANDYTKIYSIMAYVIPILVVAITVATGYLSGHRPYGGDVYCWLEGNYIWSFLVPVAIIVAGNLIVLFITLKTAYQLQHTTNVMQARVRNYRTWLRGCFSITVILGVTWLFGFFTLTDTVGGLVAAYIFTLLNASQGIFLFVFHCLLNEKIRAVAERTIALPSWLLTPTDRTQSFMTKTSGSNSNVRSFDSGSKNPDLLYRISNRPDGGDPGAFKVSRRGSIRRNESLATISSGTSGSIEFGRASDSGSMTDGSQNVLINDKRFT